MTTQLVKTETRSRGGIKGAQTGWYRVIMENFKDDMPKHSIAEYNRLLAYHERKEVRLNDRIERLEEYKKDLNLYYNYWREANQNVNRLLTICQGQKNQIEELKDKKDKTYNTVDFSTYEAEEPDTCYLCYEDIKINQHVHKCKSCSKSCHSHCYLYLPTKDHCPMCRNASF